MPILDFLSTAIVTRRPTGVWKGHKRDTIESLLLALEYSIPTASAMIRMPWHNEGFGSIEK